MTLADLRPLPCPSCGRRQDLAVWLDEPGRAWLGGRLVELQCGACHRPHGAELQRESMAIGSLAGGTAPTLAPDLRITQPGLEVEAAPEGLLVRLGERQWFVPRRKAPSVLD